MKEKMLNKLNGIRVDNQLLYLTLPTWLTINHRYVGLGLCSIYDVEPNDYLPS